MANREFSPTSGLTDEARKELAEWSKKHVPNLQCIMLGYWYLDNYGDTRFGVILEGPKLPVNPLVLIKDMGDLVETWPGRPFRLVPK